MKNIEKSRKLDHVSYDVRGPVLDEAERLMAQGVKILQLNTGNPAAFGLTAPEAVLEGFKENAGFAQAYSQSKGIIQAREAIARHCAQKGIEGVTPDDVYTGNGVSELITMCMQALLNDGDEILIPSPDYPLWTASAVLAGGRAVHYRCDESSDWYPDIKDIRSKITPRTRAIVLINPNNPTGALYPREIIEEIIKAAKENELILFSDEIYESLVMDGKKLVSPAVIDNEVITVTMNGLSKSHRLAGYRVGWMSISGPKKRAKGYIEGLNMLASMRLCSNVPAQYAIAPALESFNDADSIIQPGGRIYEQRECIMNIIGSIPGLSAVRPSAAFYVFPKLDVKRFNIKDDERFVLDFLREKHILMVHGGGFHWPEPDHFRIVYLPDVEALTTIGGRMADFMSGYRQADY